MGALILYLYLEIFVCTALYNLAFVSVAHLLCFSLSFKCMALNSLYCAHMQLRYCSRTQSLAQWFLLLFHN